MWKVILVVSSLSLSLANGQYDDFDDLSNLGKNIRESLAPLNNLGDQIRQSVYEGLGTAARQLPDNNAYGGYYQHQNNRYRYKWRPPGNVPDLSNLGSQINAQVQNSLSGLNNLGQHITDSVNHSLEPVRAMELQFRMKRGVGGTTIAKYLPNGKTFLIRNDKKFVCSGQISEANGECTGSLTPFRTQQKSDYCYLDNYSVVNNYVCLGTSTNFQIVNNVMKCDGNDPDSPALLITVGDYRKLCENVADKVWYKYFANINDPRHVEIPNANPHVKCLENVKGVCSFEEGHQLPFGSNIVVANGGSTFISSGNF